MPVGEYSIVFDSEVRDLFSLDVFSVKLEATGNNLLVGQKDDIVDQAFLDNYFARYDSLYVISNNFLLEHFDVLEKNIPLTVQQIGKDEPVLSNKENHLFKDFVGNVCITCQGKEKIPGNIAKIKADLREFVVLENQVDNNFLVNDLKKITNFPIVKELIYQQGGQVKNVFFISPSILALDTVQIKSIFASIFDYKASLLDYFINFKQKNIIPGLSWLVVLVFLVIV